MTIDESDLVVPSPDGDVPLYSATPRGGAQAAVVVVQEVFGVNDHIRDVTRKFARAGFAAAAPSLYHRFDRPVLNYDEIDEAKRLVPTLSVDALMNDIEAAVGWLGARGHSREALAVVGFCFGGKVAFLAATAPSVGAAAAVSFYGAGIGAEPTHTAPLSRLSAHTPPVLAIYEGRDPMIPLEEVDRVRSALASAGAHHRVQVFPDAGHGFFCDARPTHFDRAAAFEAWRLVQSFLADHLQDAPRPARRP